MASNTHPHLRVLATAFIGTAALAGCKAEATSPRTRDLRRSRRSL